MKQLELKINKEVAESIKVDVVDNWNELSPKQLLYVALCWQTWQEMLRKDISMQFAKAKLLTALIVGKTNKELKQILTLLGCIDYEETEINILELTHFIFEKNTLTTNKFPSLKAGYFGKVYGPVDTLANITINEFSFALNFYNRYNINGSSDDLDLFMACLYRPKCKEDNINGDVRGIFNPFLIEKHLPLIKRISFEYKQATYLFFCGCLEHFAKEFEFVFKRTAIESVNTKSTFLDVILNISGGKFGTFDQTKDQNAFIFLKELNKILEEQANKPN